MSAEAQRQAGSGQTGSIIEGEKSGDAPIGQSVATAAARFISGALGGNQQQVQLLSIHLSVLYESMAGRLIQLRHTVVRWV